jgi:hypothetical protein
MIIFVFAQLFGVGLQKLPFEFENNAELSISLAVMAVGDWKTFSCSSGYDWCMFVALTSDCSLPASTVQVWTWWISDRTVFGFVVGLVLAFIGTAIAQYVAFQGLYMWVWALHAQICSESIGLAVLMVVWCWGRFTRPDFFFVRSWLPCLIFAGYTSFASLGRGLA